MLSVVTMLLKFVIVPLVILVNINKIINRVISGCQGHLYRRADRPSGLRRPSESSGAGRPPPSVNIPLVEVQRSLQVLNYGLFYYVNYWI